MKKKITKICPNCLNPITYEEGASSIQCLYCDSFLTESQLKDSAYSGGSHSGTNAGYVSNITPASVIDSSDSGLAYLEQYFELYDWEEYRTTSDLFERKITDLVEKQKLRNANHHTSWLLEYKSIIIPLKKKLEGLEKNKQEIIQEYTGIDDTDLFDELDVYSKTIRNILVNREDLFKKLETDIKYYLQYGGDSSVAKKMTKEVEEVSKEIKKLKFITTFEDIPEIKESATKKDIEIANEYATHGINAESVYKDAIVTLSFSNDQSKALRLFTKIAKYRKSVQFINLINRIYNYNNELYQFGGLLFTTQKDKITEESSFDMKTMENVSKVPTFSLYEIIDGVPEEKPLVKNISIVLSSYGNEIFYIESAKKICSFNVETGEKKVLDTGDVGDYIYKSESIPCTTDNTILFIKKKIKIVREIESGGCSSLFKKKKQPVVVEENTSERLNNYSILSLDLKTGLVKKVVNQIVDIIAYSNNTIFYTVARKNAAKEIITTLHMLDMHTFNSKQIIDHNCLIQEVTDNKVIYTLWNPNTYNQDLYVLDKNSLEKVLIEDNIYDYFSCINDKVYYTVGNEDYLPLFSNNFEGTNRREIMQNIEEIFRISAGWMYIIKQGYYGNALVKVSEDGLTRYKVCSDFKKIIELKNGYIYYLDKDNDLHIVRSDGCNDKLIALDINANSLIIDNNHIYYTRKELVSKDRKAYSMYRMDLDGHNVKKMVFNILNMAKFDEHTIYFSQLDTVRYQVATPTSPTEYSYSYKTFNVKKFISYNKITEEFTELLTLGLPAPSSVNVKKKGCSGKTIKKDIKYIPQPKIIQYPKRRGAKVGQVEAERELQALQEQQKQQQAKTPTPSNAAGCLNATKR